VRTGLRTLTNLWWTTEILKSGEDWFETHVRGVMNWPNRKTAALWVGLPAVPSQPGALSTEPFRRHFQEETALANCWYGEHRAGRCVNFVTVLWPHAYDDLDSDRRAAVEVVESRPLGQGIGLRLRWAGEERLFGVLNDLAAPSGQEDLRPTYTADLGRTGYGPLESDAACVSMRRGPGGEWAGFINGTFLALDGQPLYQGLPHGMFQEDRSDRPGVPARFHWENLLR
jgi:hypothetical protein